MFNVTDWRALADPFAALGDLLLPTAVPSPAELSPSWEDFETVGEHVRDLLAAEQARNFCRLWSLLRRHLELDDEDVDWETRFLTELAWFTIHDNGDPDFEILDPDKLRKHLARFDAFRDDMLPSQRERFREAMLWTGEDFARWERLMTATGEESRMGALNSALTSLVKSRCQHWPEVDIHPDLFGYYTLTNPENESITIDLNGTWECEVRCLIGWEYGPDQFDGECWVLDYENPAFLVELTETLRNISIDARPPHWPFD